MSVILWLAAACTMPTRVGDGCPTVVINEVMTASDSQGIPGEDSTSDWFELHNESEQPADLSGFRLIGHTDSDNAFVLPEGFTLPPDTYQLFIARTYEDPESTAPVVGFDLNGDGDSLELRAGVGDPGIECDRVFVPDQHRSFSWQRDPESEASGSDVWCDSLAPTPGEPNADCLCGATDAC